MAAVPLLRDTNMADMTLRENTLYYRLNFHWKLDDLVTTKKLLFSLIDNDPPYVEKQGLN